MSTHVAFARRGSRAIIAIAVAATTALLLLIGNSANAAIVATVPLATSAEYSVLAGSTVTNTGPSILNQSLGLSPGTSITGFDTPGGPGTVLGTKNQTNAAAAQAQSDLTAAYTNAAGRPIDGTTTADLGGLLLQGGVYAGPSNGALSLTGTVTLDAAGDPSTVFIFQTNSTLITASSSTVALINGAQECNVFWQVGSSATLGTGSVFVGNILALTSITVNNGATVAGRALARNGAVTLDNNVFTSPSCATSTPPTTTTTPGGSGGGGTGTTPTDATPSSGTTGGGAGRGTPGSGSGSPSGPDVPSVVAPPRTGGGPISGDTLPWPALLFFGVIGVGGTVALVRNRTARLRGAASVDH